MADEKTEGKSAPAPKGPSAFMEALLRGEVPWTVRYKGVRGVEHGCVMATDAAEAEHVARAYINSQPGRVYLSVAPFILAYGSILKTVSSDAVGAGSVRR